MNNKGLTLIELLVSLVLFFLILSVSFTLLKTSEVFWNKFTDKLASFEVVSSVSGVIARDIREAKQISAEAGGERLVLIDLDDQQIQYELISGRIRRKKGGSSAYLTYDEKVDALRFDYLEEGMVSFEVGISTTETFSFKARSRNLE